MSSYNQLVQKLDSFIRKYYKNQLLKGVIYAVALGFTLFLSTVVLEYFGRFSTPVRAVLFFGFSGAILFILGKFIVIPLSKLFSFGKIISHEQAAIIVGSHFTEVKDKLLNTLQLKKLAEENENNEMLEAAIDQKMAGLNAVPFANAINMAENRKYIKYAAVPVSVFLFILFAAPSIIKDGTKRVVNYNREFKPEAPFSFNIENIDFRALEGDDYVVSLNTTGNELPQDVYIEYGGARFRMIAEGKNRFGYTIKKPSKDFSFRFFADGFYSENYTVNVVAKPSLAGMKIRLTFPKYLNKAEEAITGTGDFTVPEGTLVNWTINTRNVDNLVLLLKDSVLLFKAKENKVVFSKKVKSSLSYSLTGKNKIIEKSDTNRYLITVIPDEYPSISVDETRDSSYRSLFYFKGEIADDYGFRGLTFHFKKTTQGEDEKEGGYTVKQLNINGNQNRQSFLHAFNFSEINLSPGDEIVYFFSVFDNDGVNGSKAARTVKKTFRVPTEAELNEENEKASQSIKNDLSESLQKAEKIRRETQELNKSLMQKKNLDWQDRKKMEDLLKKQRELEKQIEELKKENQRKNEKNNEFQKPDELQQEKQKDMEKLLEELMNEELKKLLEEIEKLMQQQDKDKLQEQLKNMQNNSEDLKKQLERTLELFKQMEFDQKLEKTIEKLDKLAEEQKNLAKETEKESLKDENKAQELEKKQEELNKAFEDVRKDMDDLKKKNEALENKREELKDTEKQQQDIEQEQKKASEQLEQKQNKKASESQKQAGEKMEKMADDLKQMQQEMEDNQEAEDLESLRRILDNLIRLSFDQEDLMETLRKTNPGSPKYKELAQVQRKLKDDSKIIEDSLFALSKRVPQLQSTINKEISDIKRNMDDAVSSLSDRETPKALIRQQYSMTSINNLALMLSEAIENAQQQQQMKMQGNKACKKPGEGKPSPGEMKKLQEAQKKLSEQMKKIAEQMQKQGESPKPGEQKKPGGQDGNQGELSKQLAQMAAEQEMIRKKMQEMSDKMGDNNQRKMMQDLMNKMEQNETDLYNKRINQQTLLRQKEIEVKMLESEKALREQEMDEKRESKEGINQSGLNSEQYLQYLKLKEKQAELLRTVPPALKPYYKQKVSEYFNKL
ncbi:MAG: hypothetical protein MH137_08590 [Flavobacteriales bacterium]|nr:hypothetical protein [Flavobacteriales bacterium]